MRLLVAASRADAEPAGAGPKTAAAAPAPAGTAARSAAAAGASTASFGIYHRYPPIQAAFGLAGIENIFIFDQA
jgi:hypothetical protein